MTKNPHNPSTTAYMVRNVFNRAAESRGSKHYLPQGVKRTAISRLMLDFFHETGIRLRTTKGSGEEVLIYADPLTSEGDPRIEKIYSVLADDESKIIFKWSNGNVTFFDLGSRSSGDVKSALLMAIDSI